MPNSKMGACLYAVSLFNKNQELKLKSQTNWVQILVLPAYMTVGKFLVYKMGS